MDPLILRFHSINGSTMPEKRRDFNTFLKSLESSTSDANDLTAFISAIKPRNPTEELFRIEILMQFKQYGLLRTELKSNSPLLVRKLLKNWKLFADLFSSITVQTLVNEILPYTSHSLQSKLLNGICKHLENELLLDEYFLTLEKKYGLKTALIILPGCTVDLIKCKVTKHYIKLTNRQLITILKKDKEFLEYYFDALRKKDTNIDLAHNYNHSLNCIAKIDPGLYWKLSEKFNFNLKFGKHTTAKMLRTNNKVLKSGINYVHHFQMRQLYKTIRKDGNLKLFLLNIYPETIESLTDYNYNYNIHCFIKLLPKHELYSVIMSICKEKYGKNLLDYPEYWNQDFIKFIPIKERENILNVLVKKDEQLVYLYQTSKSIPIIKNKLQHSSDAIARSQLIGLMYKTCVFNEDKEALFEALHLVLNRYKNDIKVITKFFNNVMCWPGVVTFEEKYWKYIVDLAKIIEIGNANCYHDGEDFYTKYICHLLEHNAPCQEQCKQFMKQMLKDYGYSRLYYVDIDKKYEKQFIEQMGECVETFKDSEHYQNICVNFLKYLAKYNNQNTTAQISYNNYNHFFDQIKSCYDSQFAIEFGLKTYQTEFWHDLFWNYDENTNINYDILSWYLRNYPEKLLQNINKVVSSLDKYNIQKFVKQARKLFSENDYEKLEKHALDNLHSKDENKLKHCFNVISILKPNSLSDILLPLLTESNVETNLRKPENKILYNMLIKNLHRLGKPLDIFPLIPKFCTRYHFKLALTPLQSVAYHTPELDVKHHLMRFFDKMPSVRKQILILAKDLLAQDVYVKLLDEFSEKETNISIKNIIFMKTLQHFIENPSDSLWSLTQKNIKLLDKEDRDVFSSLVKFEKIPQEYLSQYIAFTFGEISNNVDNKIKEKRFQLLTAIPTQVIDNLSTEFLMHVIVDTACREKISNFHWKCVFDTRGQKQEHLFKKNFETLKIFAEENHHEINKDPLVRSVIINFFNRFLNIAIERKQGGNLIDKFIASWTSILQPNSFCREYTTLLFADLYFKSNFEATQTGLRMNELLCNYIDKYSPSIIPMFSRHLKQFLDIIGIEKQEEIMKLIDGFIDKKDQENIYLVVIHILGEISKMNSIDYYLKNSNIKDIQKCSSPIVKFHYNVYMVKN